MSWAIQCKNWGPKRLPPGDIRLRILNILEEEELSTRLEDLRHQRLDALLWLGDRTEGKHRHRRINGLIATEGGEDGSGVLCATGEEHKRAGCVGSTVEFAMHKNIQFEGDIFGNACGIEVPDCMTLSLR